MYVLLIKAKDYPWDFEWIWVNGSGVLVNNKGRMTKSK